MAMSNKEKLDILMKEIDNLVDLLVKVDKGSEPMDTLTGQKQKVFDLLPVTPADGIDEGRCPIYKLLSCKPLTKMQMPLDVLEKLIESGFDLNTVATEDVDELYGVGVGAVCYRNRYKGTCLTTAVKNIHYDAARCLVQHGADCDLMYTCSGASYKVHGYDYGHDRSNYSSWDEKRTPIGELASKKNAPLDLFDVLATQQNLRRRSCDDEKLPLEIAVYYGHVDNALRLIQLGAPIGRASELLLKENSWRNIFTNYHDELFTLLIPSDTLDIFKCVLMVVQGGRGYDTVQNVKRSQNKSKILHRLFQYIPIADHMSIRLEMDLSVVHRYRHTYRYSRIWIDEKVFIAQASSFQPLYWWSLLFANLGWSFKSTPQSMCPLPTGTTEEDIQLAKRIDDIWMPYTDTGRRVISLQNLCIQQTRRSMRDFSEESFMSLHVTNRLLGLLMYKHVAEIACEAVRCYMKIS